MKLLGLVLSIFLFCISVEAQKTCTTNTVKFTLASNAHPKCNSLNLNGTYQIKLCDNNRGLLTDTNESERFLYKDNNQWLTRQDLLDYTDGIAITEILKIDHQISKFLITKIKTNQNNKILEKFKCAGIFSSSRIFHCMTRQV